MYFIDLFLLPAMYTNGDNMKDNNFFHKMGFIVKCSINIFYIS